MEATRKCACCGRELTLDKFAKMGRGYKKVCKECEEKNQDIPSKESTKDMKELMKLRKENEMLSNSNISLINQMNELQQELEVLREKQPEVKTLYKVKSLEEYTPEQLMSELYRRGYRGELEVVKKCRLGAGLH